MVLTMPRPPWDTTSTPTQDEALASVVRLSKVAQAAKAKAEAAEEEMWAAVLVARNLDVSDTALTKIPLVARATLNRRYGTRKQPKSRVKK